MSIGSNSPKPPIPVYIATTIVIFFLALSAAESVGLVPNYLDEDHIASTASEESTLPPVLGELPLTDLPVLGESTEVMSGNILPKRIYIPTIGLDLVVQNPETRNITALDELLKTGPARYVDSAKLGGAGNMIIFAHSSHLPVVRNQMYKAFNRIPELKPGDSITLEGADGKSYLYTVRELHKADATEEKIDLSVSQGTILTLVTCDTLTSKSSRYILTADFVGTVGE